MTKHAQKKVTKKASVARKAPTKATKAARRPPTKTTRKARPAKAAKAPVKRVRDPRLPPAGTEIVRPYKGKDIRVTVLEDGFRWDGAEYRSLTALAVKITGARSINGPLWFRLQDRTTDDATASAPKTTRRKKAAATPDANAEVAGAE